MAVGERTFGAYSAVVALLLWSFSPYMLGHGSLMTTDVPASSLTILSAYLFWKWLKNPAWVSAIAVSIATGLAILSKSTLLAILPIYLVLWIYSFIYNQSELWNIVRSHKIVESYKLFLVTFIVVFVINGGYFFSKTFLPLGNYKFSSISLRQLIDDQPYSAFLRSIPIPLPQDFLVGIDLQKSDFEQGKSCYLRGQWQEGKGWWYFYLYALLIKIPIGTQSLAGIALYLVFFQKGYRTDLTSELLLILPILTILLLVSMQVNMTIHSRYLLPLFPFLFIWISRIGIVFEQKRLLFTPLVITLLSWSIMSSLYYYPHSLSYFNEFIGGPKNGHLHLLDSNIAWDQDLLLLKKWLDNHPEARPIKIATLGLASPNISNLHFQIPPYGPPKKNCMIPFDLAEQIELGPQPGWYAIDINRLYGISYGIPTCDWKMVPASMRGMDHSYFRFFEPIDRVGYTINIYHLTPECVNRVRKELGLSNP